VVVVEGTLVVVVDSGAVVVVVEGATVVVVVEVVVVDGTAVVGVVSTGEVASGLVAAASEPLTEVPGIFGAATVPLGDCGFPLVGQLFALLTQLPVALEVAAAGTGELDEPRLITSNAARAAMPAPAATGQRARRRRGRYM
jgi:hypothetical protein